MFFCFTSNKVDCIFHFTSFTAFLSSLSILWQGNYHGFPFKRWREWLRWSRNDPVIDIHWHGSRAVATSAQMLSHEPSRSHGDLSSKVLDWKQINSPRENAVKVFLFSRGLTTFQVQLLFLKHPKLLPMLLACCGRLHGEDTGSPKQHLAKFMGSHVKGMWKGSTISHRKPTPRNALLPLSYWATSPAPCCSSPVPLGLGQNRVRKPRVFSQAFSAGK